MAEEVDEAFMLIFKLLGGSADLLKQGLQMTGSIIGTLAMPVAGAAGKATGELLSKPLEAGKNFVSKNIPKIGDKGQVSAETLKSMDGDTICVGEFADDELKEIKKQLKKYQVDFCALKDRSDGSEAILIKAQNAQIAQNAIAKVARNMNLLTEEEIKSACEPQISEDMIKAEPKLLENPKDSLEVDGETWNLTKSDGWLEYTAEYGLYDLKANSNGSWLVSKMGEPIEWGQNVAGLKSAMLEARATADEMGKPKHERLKVIDSKKAEKPTLQKNQNKRQEVKATKRRKHLPPTEKIAQASARLEKHKAEHPQEKKTQKHSKGAR